MCNFRRHDSAQTTTAPQKRHHAPSLATIVTTSRSVSENELPEAESHLSVSEPSLYYVVTFVHIILSLEVFQNLLHLQSPATQHLRVFDIRDRWASQIIMHFPSLREHAFHRWMRMKLLRGRKLDSEFFYCSTTPDVSSSEMTCNLNLRKAINNGNVNLSHVSLQDTSNE